MNRYIALLRGINVSGKNKIAMAELKMEFNEMGFMQVATYLNSGNVVFSSETSGTCATSMLAEKIKRMIEEKFHLDIPVFVIESEELEEILDHAPDWWGDENKEIYDNLIFLIPPATFEEIYEKIGKPNEENEKIQNYKNGIFWSFVRKDYTKTNWWSKTATPEVGSKITIRTANTVRKLAGLCSQIQ